MQRSDSIPEMARRSRLVVIWIAMVTLVLALLPLSAGAAEDPVQPDLAVPSTLDCFDTLNTTLTIEGENITQSGPLHSRLWSALRDRGNVCRLHRN